MRASLLALALTGCTCGTRAVDPPTNLLLIVADDLGVDNVSGWGVHPRSASTPVIDALARDGVRFHNAWAYPECSPTRAALLTGRYGRRTGVGQRIANTRVSRPFQLPLSEQTLPELVSGAPTPWTTSATGKWHLTNEAAPDWQTHPTDSGFGWYAGPISNLDAQGHRSGSYFQWNKTTNGVTAPTTRYATSDTTDDAIERARSMPEPWFLYVAHAAPHGPFHDPPPELLDEPVRSSDPPTRYRAMVQAMDREIGRLLDGIDPEVRARTMVVFVGDNGTPREAVLPPSLPERAKNSLYEGGIRVPLVVSGAGVRGRGSVSQALVHVVDIFATVAGVAGASPANPIDGISLLPALSDPTWTGRDALYAEMFRYNGAPPYERDLRAVRDHRHKLIRTAEGIEHLYDLEASENPLLEGENLLDQGGLTPAQQGSYARLQRALNELERELIYAHGP